MSVAAKLEPGTTVDPEVVVEGMVTEVGEVIVGEELGVALHVDVDLNVTSTVGSVTRINSVDPGIA